MSSRPMPCHPMREEPGILPLQSSLMTHFSTWIQDISAGELLSNYHTVESSWRKHMPDAMVDISQARSSMPHCHCTGGGRACIKMQWSTARAAPSVLLLLGLDADDHSALFPLPAHSKYGEWTLWTCRRQSRKISMQLCFRICLPSGPWSTQLSTSRQSALLAC